MKYCVYDYNILNIHIWCHHLISTSLKSMCQINSPICNKWWSKSITTVSSLISSTQWIKMHHINIHIAQICSKLNSPKKRGYQLKVEKIVGSFSWTILEILVKFRIWMGIEIDRLDMKILRKIRVGGWSQMKGFKNCRRCWAKPNKII